MVNDDRREALDHGHHSPFEPVADCSRCQASSAATLHLGNGPLAQYGCGCPWEEHPDGSVTTFHTETCPFVASRRMPFIVKCLAWIQKPVITERGSRSEAMLLLFGGLGCGLVLGLILGAWLW